ncbi:hypothetical protein O6H91_05G087100 [Diphasiastrum complanatum]|uniref:Uncharacterized protein n=1 Tax=Diphasiastrum complanatum TaxID=34168 RepID=A0ACC2DQP3_DIPCM|nr:hypothetical protein O6H91_05G087100 [Diphasiastrum complanatum]
MGCVGSKVQDEVAVLRCRQGKRYLKRAMKSHNALAIAHADYITALKTTGAAFRKFAEFEFKQQQHLSASPPSSDTEASSSSRIETSKSTSFRQMAYQNTPFPSKTVIVSPLPPMAYQNTPFVSDRVVLSPVRMMAHQTTPFGSETVVVSPPRSPDDQRSWNGYFNYQDYLYNDAPPAGVNSNTPATSSQEEPASYQYPPPSPPPPIFSSGWEWLDLFRAAPMSMHFQEPRRYKHEDSKQVVEEEEIPALEVEGTPPREKKGEQKDEIEEVKADERNHVTVENDNLKEVEPEEHQKENLEELSHKDEIRSLTPSKLEPEEMFTKKDLDPTATNIFRKSRNMLELLTEIDVQFSKAFESGKNVSKVLEASKIHYYSSFGDLRVSRGYWSPRTPLSSISSSSTSTSTSEDSTAEDPGLLGSHASTLDKLYAWEKKLYKEVKGLESSNIEFERKCRRLQTLLDKGEGDEKIERARASRKALETEVIVAGQAMDETVSAIRNLIDDELYPQLLQLIEGSTTMWKEMCACHQHQRDAVAFLHIPDEHALETTSYAQRQVTLELQSALDTWQSNFSAVVSIQREYIRNLNMWLSISLFRPDRESMQRAASLPTKATPRIYHLCQQWKQALDKLPDKKVVNALKQFSEIVRRIVRLHDDEYFIKKKLDSLTKDVSKKIQALRIAERKHGDPVAVKKENSANEHFAIRGPLDDQREELERLRRRVEQEQEKYNQAVRETRSSTLRGLKEGLPELFEALSDFATECAQKYQSLYSQAKNGKLAL